jgi:hypothetical protein
MHKSLTPCSSDALHLFAFTGWSQRLFLFTLSSPRPGALPFHSFLFTRPPPALLACFLILLSTSSLPSSQTSFTMISTTMITAAFLSIAFGAAPVLAGAERCSTGYCEFFNPASATSMAAALRAVSLRISYRIRSSRLTRIAGI